ncbi:MAG: CDP-diacylglycerol--glycerol-3-phosphate 3-phosphatidyltransferase [Pirellulales bacterium]|nr:CDP-diacylglycerol--glycerol-3-phosphate 3-phosphatidyltransferase [Pirellulales bacterium]
MKDEKPSPMNLPNALTVLRLVFALVLFIFLAAGSRGWTAGYGWGFVLFLLAAVTDWLDGYIARRWMLITPLGRVLDPFADKVIVCGTFIFLAAAPGLRDLAWGLQAWMVVVIVVRELLVTVLRSMIEERGGDFSAKWSGKIKMVLQCTAAATCLFYLTYENPPENAPAWCTVLLIASVWATVAATVYSGVVYVFAAVRILKENI